MREYLLDVDDIAPDGRKAETGERHGPRPAGGLCPSAWISKCSRVRGLENEIRSPRIQKLGMGLAGYTGYIHPDRVQIFGSSES